MKRLASVATLVLLWILLPLGASAAEFLIPVGKIVGLQLKSDTVVISAFDDRLGKNARAAGLRVGDEILAVNEKNVTDAMEIRSEVERCKDHLELTVRRGNKTFRCNVKPQSCAQGQKMGVYLKQGISGIGTVTWYDPATGMFGALGHGVNTAKGDPLKMTSGNAYDAEIISVKKGESGEPGQLRGAATSDVPRGTLTRNTPKGIFGKTEKQWQGEPVPAAQWQELKTGPAVILSTIGGDEPREYSVEIVKVYAVDRPDGRNMMLHVTDPALLETTGGIVQGMSGSPILQNGRLVGAVTHVLVNDPTMGYGIFIQNMLDAA